MSVLQILGASKASSPSEGPLELLLGCHQRIRTFTELAARVASSEPASDADVADAARRVHRYHAIALPLHQADEEQSIGPRLAPLVAPEIRYALGGMRRQHQELDETLATLLPLWERLATEPGRRRQLVARMEKGVARMKELWAHHLSVEEDLIFPEVNRVLNAAQLAAITGEMRARRLPR
ncbi:MAG TPA: hemerythrin domain-containing protein [Myxococcales bacterium]|nr:hemerythrin domain-containing protein [Myxococcales bacterium]